MEGASRQTVLNKKYFKTPNGGAVTKSKNVRKQKAEPRSTKTCVRLFENTTCLVNYHAKFFLQKEASLWFSILSKNVEWQEEEAIIFGKSITVPRKMAYFGNFSYRYSGSSKRGQGWPEWLTPLKTSVEDFLGTTFNYALMNYYKDGTDYIGYHSDDERDLMSGSVIASISFGAERDFLFKRRYAKTFTGKKENVTKLRLAHGSMLTMGGTTQSEYKHSLPKRASCKTSRINVTFRNVRETQ
jgi:alkylated DNA repair dioxygenase AlkB